MTIARRNRRPTAEEIEEARQCVADDLADEADIAAQEARDIEAMLTRSTPRNRRPRFVDPRDPLTWPAS